MVSPQVEPAENRSEVQGAGFARAEEMLPVSDAALARVDPARMNLLVARGIPSLAELNVGYYCRILDEWAAAIRDRIPTAEPHFWRSPQSWKNDIHFFRLGIMCEYLDCELGIRYKEDHRELQAVRYTDPADLFLNGVIDTRRGTCGNMAVLHVAIGWRLGWPVSLAMVASHCICRYDDGNAVHNIETTQTGDGGFSSRTDEQYMKAFSIHPRARQIGSDLTSLTPRQMLGVFFGLRARHFVDTDRLAEADADYSLARWLFPNNQRLYLGGTEAALSRKHHLFAHPGPILVFE